MVYNKRRKKNLIIRYFVYIKIRYALNTNTEEKLLKVKGIYLFSCSFNNIFWIVFYKNNIYAYIWPSLRKCQKAHKKTSKPLKRKNSRIKNLISHLTTNNSVMNSYNVSTITSMHFFGLHLIYNNTIMMTILVISWKLN